MKADRASEGQPRTGSDKYSVGGLVADGSGCTWW